MTAAEKAFDRYKDSHEYLDPDCPVLSEIMERFEAEGTELISFERFFETSCPNCGASGWFKWHFLGHLKHPGCGGEWYINPGTYAIEQIRRTFRAGMVAGFESAQDTKKPQGCLESVFGFVFLFFLVGGFRLAGAVISIPIQAILYLGQGSSQKSAPSGMGQLPEVSYSPGSVPFESRSASEALPSISDGRQRNSLFAPMSRAAPPLAGGTDAALTGPPGPPPDARPASIAPGESSPDVLSPPAFPPGGTVLADPTPTQTETDSRALRCHRFDSDPVDFASGEPLNAPSESVQNSPEVDLASDPTLEQPVTRNEDGHSWDDFLHYFKGLSDPEKAETLASLEGEARDFLLRLCRERGVAVPVASASDS